MKAGGDLLETEIESAMDNGRRKNFFFLFTSQPCIMALIIGFQNSEIVKENN